METVHSSRRFGRLEDLSSGFQVNQFVPQLSSTFTHIILSYLNDNRYGATYPLNPGKRNIDFRASLPSLYGNSQNVIGYFDFIEVLYDRQFRADNNILRFTTPDTAGVLQFEIPGFTSSDMKVIDVTQHQLPVIINYTSFENGTLKFQSTVSQTSPRQFFAIAGNNYKTPASTSSRLQNQNIKGDLATGCSFIIITPKEFVSAANRLKAQREQSGP